MHQDPLRSVTMRTALVPTATSSHRFDPQIDAGHHRIEPDDEKGSVGGIAPELKAADIGADGHRGEQEHERVLLTRIGDVVGQLDPGVRRCAATEDAEWLP